MLFSSSPLVNSAIASYIPSQWLCKTISVLTLNEYISLLLYNLRELYRKDLRR
nr:MAG TPA: hypothetical protein [Bacteriophage sp.]